jgi:hypothetical protein
VEHDLQVFEEAASELDPELEGAGSGKLAPPHRALRGSRVDLPVAEWSRLPSRSREAPREPFVEHATAAALEDDSAAAWRVDRVRGPDLECGQRRERQRRRKPAARDLGMESPTVRHDLHDRAAVGGARREDQNDRRR